MIMIKLRLFSYQQNSVFPILSLKLLHPKVIILHKTENRLLDTRTSDSRLAQFLLIFHKWSKSIKDNQKHYFMFESFLNFWMFMIWQSWIAIVNKWLYFYFCFHNILWIWSYKTHKFWVFLFYLTSSVNLILH